MQPSVIISAKQFLHMGHHLGTHLHGIFLLTYIAKDIPLPVFLTDYNVAALSEYA